jgi:hypothetical protein
MLTKWTAHDFCPLVKSSGQNGLSMECFITHYGSVADRFIDRSLAVLTVVGSDRLLAVRFCGFWALGGDFCLAQIVFEMIFRENPILCRYFLVRSRNIFKRSIPAKGKNDGQNSDNRWKSPVFLANQ